MEHTVCNTKHKGFTQAPLFRKNKNGAGFTLIELLVAISIFAVVITAFLGLFSSAFHYQQKNLKAAYLLSNSSYISEFMSRALRMAKKDIGGVCIGEKENFELISDNHVKFLNQDNDCQEFLTDGNRIEVRKNGVPLFLSPSNLTVEGLKFEVSGESQSDNYQPKITFILEIKNDTEELSFQSTVSQRDLDIQY